LAAAQGASTTNDAASASKVKCLRIAKKKAI
jgi:hypothetical protein